MPDRATPATPPARRARTPRVALWALLAATVAAGVAVIAFPTFYIMPFRTQDSAVMAWALAARTVAPAVTLAAAVAATLLAGLTAMRSRRWWSRALAVIVLAPVFLGAWFARQNHYEWMFEPQATIEHVAAEEATFVQPDDLVMAVTLQGAALAYPIRQLAYHHIANDVVAGEPIVATY